MPWFLFYLSMFSAAPRISSSIMSFSTFISTSWTSLALRTLKLSFYISLGAIASVEQTQWCETCLPWGCCVVRPDYLWHFIHPLSLFLIIHAFLDCWEYQPICSFHNPIRLRM
jgi:hypothetical protein